MNKKKIIIPAVAILLLCGLIGLANTYHWLGFNAGIDNTDLPNAGEELKKIYAVYTNPDSPVTIAGRIRLFDTENENTLKEEKTFSFSRNGNMFYSQLDYLQTICADSLVVQLDTMNNSISVSKFSPQAGQSPVQSMLPLEKMIQDTASTKLSISSSASLKERIITITSELNPEIKSSKIFYDARNYKIRKTEIEWRKQESTYEEETVDKKIWLTVMEYNYPSGTGLSPAERIKRIITITDGKMEPASFYKGYQFQVFF